MFRVQARVTGTRILNVFQQKGLATVAKCLTVHGGSTGNRWSSSSRGATRRRRRPLTVQFHEEEEEQPKKIMFQSLGCPRNFVDTEVMLGLSVKSGMEITQSVQDADYLVVNTCGFLESARQESREVIQDLANHKKQNSKLLVTGCMVNLHKDQILQDFPQVDSVLGSGAIDKVIETIQKLEENNGTSTKDPLVQSAHRRSFLARGDVPRFLATPPHYAYLKIAEGCKKQCAFCIIPKIKGRLQSKPIPELVEEFQAVLEHGASEIILIAQDLGDYGKDFKSSSTSPNANFRTTIASPTRCYR